MKTVLVTGGTGFIGSNLSLRLIERGHKVKIFRRPDSDLRAIRGIDAEQIRGDVRDVASLRSAMHGCDTVFHTAALVTFARKRKALQYEVNVIGTRNVVEACIAEGVERLVHTSSIAAIGHPSAGEVATEETPFNWEPPTGYRISKREAEQEVKKGVTRGLDAVIVNPAVVVGERDIHFHGGQLLKEAKRGLNPFYLDGGMNVVYVQDVVRGHIEAASKGRTGERYILGGHNLTHKQIFTRVAELVGGRPPFVNLPIPLLRSGARVIEAISRFLGIEPVISSDMVAGAGKFNWYSSAKAQRELNYTITPFDESILSALKWYNENGFL